MNESLFDVMKSLLKSFQDDLHTSLPGAIVNYDPETRLASVIPQMKKKYQGGQILAMPVIHNVPVQFSASAKASISFPLEKGDEGMIFFSERSIDEWMKSGQADLPDDARRFSLDDAFFIPGTFSRKNTRAGSKDGLLAEYKTTKIEVLDKEIVMSFGLITSIKFSETGMDITTAAGKYSAISHVHNDVEQRPTTPPLPV